MGRGLSSPLQTEGSRTAATLHPVASCSGLALWCSCRPGCGHAIDAGRQGSTTCGTAWPASAVAGAVTCSSRPPLAGCCWQAAGRPAVAAAVHAAGHPGSKAGGVNSRRSSRGCNSGFERGDGCNRCGGEPSGAGAAGDARRRGAGIQRCQSPRGAQCCRPASGAVQASGCRRQAACWGRGVLALAAPCYEQTHL